MKEPTAPYSFDLCDQLTAIQIGIQNYKNRQGHIDQGERLYKGLGLKIELLEQKKLLFYWGQNADVILKVAKERYFTMGKILQEWCDTSFIYYRGDTPDPRYKQLGTQPPYHGAYFLVIAPENITLFMKNFAKLEAAYIQGITSIKNLEPNDYNTIFEKLYSPTSSSETFMALLSEKDNALASDRIVNRL